MIDQRVAETIWREACIGLAEVSTAGKFLRANPYLCELLEYTASELAGKTFQSITHPEDVNDDLSMVKALLAGELDHYVMTKRYLTKRNRVVWIKLYVHPITRADGSVELFCVQVDAKMVSTDSSGMPKAPQASGAFKAHLFVKDHWKWLIAATIAAVSFITTLAVERARISDRMDRQEQAMEKQERATDLILKKLEGLERR